MEWQVQEAKQRFSELIRTAQADGPQIVTRHGQQIAVVLEISDWRHLLGQSTEFKEYLRSGPDFGDLDLSRPADRSRSIDWALARSG